ncbi:MAG TPA: M20 family metallopeptidase [Bacteroidia bacterium]|nr:M20 family metallopeptidase [Bacteroidia bacterium]
MDHLKTEIKELAARYAAENINNRRHLHAHPELSYQEYETAKFVETRLQEYGITKFERKADTGVIAIIECNNPTSKTIALRGDMDALPITEANEVPYKSQNPGVMHACGHDVHTSSLLGTARILNQLKDKLEGTIKLVFQPGEEKIPGGASLLINEGVLEAPKVQKMLGQHVMPQIEAGKIGFRSGLYMASADELYITVKGKGGHGAMPQFNIDPVVIASHIIIALQQIVSRVASPLNPTVLSFGKVIANGATNVIPNEVKIDGTFRALNEEWRAEAHKRMIKMATGIAESMGGSCDFRIDKGYPFLKNDEALTAAAKSYAEEFVGKENIIDLDIWMASEDFAFYSQIVPSCFYRLGTGNKARGITSSVHTPTFDVDESALELGVGLMSWLAVRELGNK